MLQRTDNTKTQSVRVKTAVKAVASRLLLLLVVVVVKVKVSFKGVEYILLLWPVSSMGVHDRIFYSGGICVTSLNGVQY